MSRRTATTNGTEGTKLNIVEKSNELLDEVQSCLSRAQYDKFVELGKQAAIALASNPKMVVPVTDFAGIVIADGTDDKVVLVAGEFPDGKIEVKEGTHFTSKSAIQINCFEKRARKTIIPQLRVACYSAIVAFSELEKPDAVAACEPDAMAMAKAKLALKRKAEQPATPDFDAMSADEIEKWIASQG